MSLGGEAKMRYAPLEWKFFHEEGAVPLRLLPPSTRSSFGDFVDLCRPGTCDVTQRKKRAYRLQSELARRNEQRQQSAFARRNIVPSSPHDERKPRRCEPSRRYNEEVSWRLARNGDRLKTINRQRAFLKKQAQDENELVVKQICEKLQGDGPQFKHVLEKMAWARFNSAEFKVASEELIAFTDDIVQDIEQLEGRYSLLRGEALDDQWMSDLVAQLGWDWKLYEHVHETFYKNWELSFALTEETLRTVDTMECFAGLLEVRLPGLALKSGHFQDQLRCLNSSSKMGLQGGYSSDGFYAPIGHFWDEDEIEMGDCDVEENSERDMDLSDTIIPDIVSPSSGLLPSPHGSANNLNSSTSTVGSSISNFGSSVGTFASSTTSMSSGFASSVSEPHTPRTLSKLSPARTHSLSLWVESWAQEDPMVYPAPPSSRVERPEDVPALSPTASGATSHADTTIPPAPLSAQETSAPACSSTSTAAHNSPQGPLSPTLGTPPSQRVANPSPSAGPKAKLHPSEYAPSQRIANPSSSAGLEAIPHSSELATSQRVANPSPSAGLETKPHLSESAPSQRIANPSSSAGLEAIPHSSELATSQRVANPSPSAGLETKPHLSEPAPSQRVANPSPSARSIPKSRSTSAGVFKNSAKVTKSSKATGSSKFASASKVTKPCKANASSGVKKAKRWYGLKAALIEKAESNAATTEEAADLEGVLAKLSTAPTLENLMEDLSTTMKTTPSTIAASPSSLKPTMTNLAFPTQGVRTSAGSEDDTQAEKSSKDGTPSVSHGDPAPVHQHEHSLEDIQSAEYADIKGGTGPFDPDSIDSWDRLRAFFMNKTFSSIVAAAHARFERDVQAWRALNSTYMSIITRSCRWVLDSHKADWFDVRQVVRDADVFPWILQIKKILLLVKAIPAGFPQIKSVDKFEDTLYLTDLVLNGEAAWGATEVEVMGGVGAFNSNRIHSRESFEAFLNSPIFQTKFVQSIESLKALMDDDEAKVTNKDTELIRRSCRWFIDSRHEHWFDIQVVGDKWTEFWIHEVVDLLEPLKFYIETIEINPVLTQLQSHLEMIDLINHDKDIDVGYKVGKPVDQYPDRPKRR
ncbi:hypothetical protein NX059_011456 [Plenodomus lindquistii]|nr:hypothetical protein NX059_011456 [Plenodomus lindquistii]